jgi:hypothetical protein
MHHEVSLRLLKYLTPRSRKAKSRSASPEIPRILWNQKVRYHVHKSPSLVPVLSQMHPVHTLTLYFQNIRGRVTFDDMIVFSRWGVVRPRPVLKLKGHPVSAIRYCVCNADCPHLPAVSGST